MHRFTWQILMSLFSVGAAQINPTFYDSVLVLWETQIAHPAEVFYFSLLTMSFFLVGGAGLYDP